MPVAVLGIRNYCFSHWHKIHVFKLVEYIQKKKKSNWSVNPRWDLPMNICRSQIWWLIATWLKHYISLAVFPCEMVFTHSVQDCKKNEEMNKQKVNENINLSYRPGRINNAALYNIMWTGIKQSAMYLIMLDVDRHGYKACVKYRVLNSYW